MVFFIFSIHPSGVIEHLSGESCCRHGVIIVPHGALHTSTMRREDLAWAAALSMVGVVSRYLRQKMSVCLHLKGATWLPNKTLKKKKLWVVRYHRTYVSATCCGRPFHFTVGSFLKNKDFFVWMESVRCVISFQGFECTLNGRSSLERTFWNIFLFKVGKNSTHPQFHADLEHTILHVKTFMCDETSRYTGQKFGQPQQKTKNKKQKTTSCVCTDLKHTKTREIRTQSKQPAPYCE